MPKPPRETSDPLGRKLLAVLRDKGQADNLNALAAALEVTVQSTYDYIKHGRLSKDRYPLLVAWSGRSLDWWFDIDTTKISSPSPVSPAGVKEPDARPYSAWPVPGMTISEIREQLTPEQRAEVSGFIKGILSTGTRKTKVGVVVEFKGAALKRGMYTRSSQPKKADAGPTRLGTVLPFMRQKINDIHQP